MRSYNYIFILFFIFFGTTNAFSTACSGLTSVQIQALTSTVIGNSKCTTAADLYKMTVTAGEFYNSKSAERFEIKKANATYDIASEKFDYIPQITNIQPGTYDQFRGYADNVFVIKGGFTTTDSKPCVTYGTMDATYLDFRDSGIKTAANKTSVTVTMTNFGAGIWHYTDGNSNLIEFVDSSNNRATSNGTADRIRVTYTLPTVLTLEKTDKVKIKMYMGVSSSITHEYATSDGSGAYNCSSVGMHSPLFTMTVTKESIE